MNVPTSATRQATSFVTVFDFAAPAMKVTEGLGGDDGLVGAAVPRPEKLEPLYPPLPGAKDTIVPTVAGMEQAAFPARELVSKPGIEQAISKYCEQE
ncbi:MAG: hypothetical protein Q9219_000817 [cf. Caloplaca sp. 3 TL-2023]